MRPPAAILAMVLAACSRTALDATPGDAGPPDPCAGCVGACVDRHCSLPTQIAAALRHTCTLLETGEVMCWGSNEEGILGSGHSDGELHTFPSQVPGVSGALQIAVSDTHACARLKDGSVTCWGSNAWGQVGRDGAYTSAPWQLSLAGVTDVAVGPGYSCASSKDLAWCWGDDNKGQLGDQAAVASSPHPLVVPLPAPASSFALGLGHACAVTTGGEVWCWGANDVGQVGTGVPTGDMMAPHQVPALAWVTSASAGELTTCATRLDGVLACWGGGQAQAFPSDTQGATDVLDVALGTTNDGACVRRTSGAVWCGTLVPSPSAGGLTFNGSAVLKAGATEITTGAVHRCALLQDGSALCWGDNTYGQLGDGTTHSRSAPGNVTF